MSILRRRIVRRTACAGFGLVLAAGGFAPAVANASSRAPGPAAPLTVHTDDGVVRGFDDGTSRAFLGIPFAAPPVGALRWRPPALAAKWTGMRDATRPGSVCAQTANVAGVPNTSTSEDCLYLNVYTPTNMQHHDLPVMVWIHGGAFTGGAGSVYDGGVLASKGDVIVVTVNYRLSAFGFLALPALDQEGASDSSGDFGLLDQQAALRWVQRNAASFGGDAHNVTIFGQSSGAQSVCGNMASPDAAGLFTRAIAESGCLIPMMQRQAAEAEGGALATSLGCADPGSAAACLRSKSASQILAAEANDSWAPATGGPSMPLAPAGAFAAGTYNRVPLLQGTNHDEGRFFVALQYDAQGRILTADQYPSALTNTFGPVGGPFVLAEYPLSDYPSPELALAATLTDAEFSCPSLRADFLAAGSDVFAYEFSDPAPPNTIGFGFPLSYPLGAAHSTELQYVFQRVLPQDTAPPFTPEQLALSNQIIRYWTTFAATGDPHGTGAASSTRWPRFDPQQPQILQLVPSATAPAPAADFATAHRCSFWRGP
jgi:para-nitrobenzyl esterase